MINNRQTWSSLAHSSVPVIVGYTFLSNEQIYGTKEDAAQKAIIFGKRHANTIVDYFMSFLFPDIGPDARVVHVDMPGDAQSAALRDAVELANSSAWQRFARIKSTGSMAFADGDADEFDPDDVAGDLAHEMSQGSADIVDCGGDRDQPGR